VRESRSSEGARARFHLKEPWPDSDILRNVGHRRGVDRAKKYVEKVRAKGVGTAKKGRWAPGHYRFRSFNPGRFDLDD